jgi:hypothetical protein
MSRRLSRRTLLRGALGTAISLPFLEAMQPLSARASGATPPKRVVFVYIPVGFRHMDVYTPIEKPTGTIPYTLPPVLAPLADVQAKLTIIGNVANHASEGGNGDAHERGTASLLTCQPAILSGSNVTNGISVDQVVAARSTQTPLPSLELGVDSSSDSGKSVMQTNIAWKDATTPIAKETDPGRLWDRLFSELALSPSELALRRARKTSVLDYANQSTKDLRAKLGKVDQAKLDQYLTGIASLEARLNSTSQCIVAPPPSPDGQYDNSGATDLAATTGLTAHHDLMLDLLVHAFACDITRVASFMFVRGTFSDWQFLGFQEEHHYMSHFPDENVDRLDGICTWEMERFARFLKGLDAVQESDGTTLLDNTLIVVSSDVADGQLHNVTNLPVFLAGGGNTVTKAGQFIKPAKEQSLANVYLSMLRFAGITDVKKFGLDGTAPLDELMI